MGRRVPWSIAAGLVLALVLGGCSALVTGLGAAGPASSVGGGGSTRVVSYDGFVAEYRASLSTLSWPAGVTPDPNPMNSDKSSAYEVGSGEGGAVARWMCAWGDVYLKNRTSNLTVARAALDEWASITRLPAWNRAYSDPNTQRLLLDAISKARLGDASVIQSLQTANCQ
jgi:hypothetical protein